MDWWSNIPVLKADGAGSEHKSSPGLWRMISLQGLTTHAHLKKQTRLRWGQLIASLGFSASLPWSIVGGHAFIASEIPARYGIGFCLYHPLYEPEIIWVNNSHFLVTESPTQGSEPRATHLSQRIRIMLCRCAKQARLAYLWVRDVKSLLKADPAKVKVGTRTTTGIIQLLTDEQGNQPSSSSTTGLLLIG